MKNAHHNFPSDIIKLLNLSNLQPKTLKLIHFCKKKHGTTHPKQLTVIHTLVVVAAMQGADQHIRSSFGVQFLAQGHFNMQNSGMEPATSQ